MSVRLKAIANQMPWQIGVCILACASMAAVVARAPETPVDPLFTQQLCLAKHPPTQPSPADLDLLGAALESKNDTLRQAVESWLHDYSPKGPLERQVLFSFRSVPGIPRRVEVSRTMTPTSCMFTFWILEGVRVVQVGGSGWTE